jgi:hypothetical protein
MQEDGGWWSALLKWWFCEEVQEGSLEEQVLRYLLLRMPRELFVEWHRESGL